MLGFYITQSYQIWEGPLMPKEWTPDDLKSALDAGNPVFLKLYKHGCGACKLSEPAIERLEASNTHNLIFGQIDVEAHPELLDLSDSEVIPAFFVFKDKKLSGKIVGFKGLEKLKGLIAEAFG